MVKKINDTANNSIHTNNLPAEPGLFSWKEPRISEASIEQLSMDLLIWAQTNEDAFTITQFFDQRGIWHDQVPQWIEKWPKFARAFAQAKLMIGSRREVAAIKKKIDAKAMMWSQHSYGPEWREIDEYHHALRTRRESAEDKIINVIINSVPESPLVQAALKRRKSGFEKI